MPIKTQEQLDVQAMHPVRDRLMQRRTALNNEIREVPANMMPVELRDLTTRIIRSVVCGELQPGQASALAQLLSFAAALYRKLQILNHESNG